MIEVKPFKPQNFGRYLLTERIAVGGMAEIFKAKLFGAMGFQRELVIKRILPQYAEDAEFLRMFITEAKLVCHLVHPNILQVHELGELDGQYFIGMEYVHGIDARQMWRTLAKRRQRLPGVLALFVVAEFLKGLDYAHRAVGADGELLGVVHRDVSPSNVLISFRGDVKIGDFGIALVQQESKTQAGVLKGKYGYMSPEQVAGLKVVDHRSDIFTSGIVLAELLLGRRLFLGRSDFETLDKVMNVRLDILDRHENALPDDVVRIVRNALQRKVAERYQSAREFHEDISEFLYKRNERITNETLASFVAHHVTPYLVERVGADSGSSIPEESGGLVDEASGTPSPPRSPRVPSAIIPRDAELSPESKGKKGSQSGENLLEEVSSSFRSGEFSDLIKDEKPLLTTEANLQEEPSDPELAATPQSSISAPIEQPQKIAVPPPAIQGPPTTHEPPIPLWENIIDEKSGQFGAIPQLDLVEDVGIGLELDLSPGLEVQRDSDGILEAPLFGQSGAGEELDLSGSFEDTTPLASQKPILDKGEPSVMISARLASAQETKAKDRPDFAGTLSMRTVTKVLFRFCVAKETGLLTITGPRSASAQSAKDAWVREMITRTTNRKVASPSELTCEIHLVEGQPHLVSSDRNEETLIGYLLRQEILTEREVERALTANPHRGYVAAMLTAGLMAPLHVSRHTTSLVVDEVVNSFLWTEGNFAFYRGKKCSDESFPTDLDSLGLILKGTAILTQKVLDSYFVALGNRTLVAKNTPPVRIDEFQQNELMINLFRVLNRPQTIAEAMGSCTHLDTPLNLKRALYTLIECEMMEVGN
ncbi:MAG: serine/threonine-protein kinase [Pseudomonadota bacterium]